MKTDMDEMKTMKKPGRTMLEPIELPKPPADAAGLKAWIEGVGMTRTNADAPGGGQIRLASGAKTTLK